MKVLVYSTHGFDRPFLEKVAVNKHELIYTDVSLNVETAYLAKGCDAVALFTSDNASSDVLEILHSNNMRYVALRSVGYEHIDIPKAHSLGMKVANVPEYSPYAIAEHTVGLLLSLIRNMREAQLLMQENNFLLDSLVGFDLHGKTIGIVGTGQIGSAFVRIMHGFGCKLIGYDIKENSQLVKDTGIKYTSLNDLCRQSDVISVNCPLNYTTKYMFNKSLFSQMKKGVVFLNTARGGIVKTVDLLDALDKGIVKYAGLDVYENEKSIFFHDFSGKQIDDELFQNLRSRSNVLITGHQAFLTIEALEGIATTTISNLDEWEKSGTSCNDLLV